jgi:site-specific DNA-methyltransferase (adenine-specific)
MGFFLPTFRLDLPQIEVTMLLKGDCLQLMRDIPSGSVDMILTDPPYGTTSCKWDNVIPFEPMWEQIWRVLKPNGACLLFGSEPFSSALRMSQIKRFKYDWIWDKKFGANFLNSNKMPLKHHEIISVFGEAQTVFFKITAQRTKPLNATSWANRKKLSKVNAQSLANFQTTSKVYEQKNPISILEFSSVSNECNNTKRVHPTQKPVALLEYLIKTYTIEGETVLDFTMGSGSTGVACINTGRKFIGIEMDDKYFEIAKQRIANEKGPA